MWSIFIHHYAMLGQKGKVEKSGMWQYNYVCRCYTSSVPENISGKFNAVFFEYSSLVEYILRTKELQTQLKLFSVIRLLVVVLTLF